MKKIFALSICLMPAISYGQPDLEKILRQEHFVNNNWVTDFKEARQWQLVATIMVGFDKEKITIDSANKRDYFYRFTSDTLFSTNSGNSIISFFPQHRSFYINPVASENNQMLSLYSPFHVHYMDATYMVVERIYHNFDVYTGRTLTEEEARVLFRKEEGAGTNAIKKAEQQRHFELWRRHG